MHRFGDVLHYRWGGEQPRPHSAAMFIGRSRDDLFVILPLADSNWNIDPYKSFIVGKSPYMYEACTARCEYHPDHEENQ